MLRDRAVHRRGSLGLRRKFYAARGGVVNSGRLEAHLLAELAHHHRTHIVRHRAPTNEAGSQQKGLLMAFELLEMAQKRWRRINGAHAIPLVRGGRFTDGVEVERRTDRERPRA